MKKDDKNEASTVASISGFQQPEPYDRLIKKKSEVNSPFENIVTISALNQEELPETVKKRGDHWVLFDDEKKDVVLGTFDKREKAWDKQRMMRKRKKVQKDLKKKMDARRKDAAEPQQIKSVAKKKEESFNFLKDKIKKILTESKVTYFFEQPQNDKDAIEWENFIEKLSRETLMADKKLKNVIMNLEKNKLKVLKNSMNIVKDALQSSKGRFQVTDMKSQQDEETGEARISFGVKMKTSKEPLIFSMKIENSRPLIHIPPNTTQELNMLSNDQSKLLRAELIHVQETQLNNVEDIVISSEKRDNYLRMIEKKVDKFMTGLTPIEIAVLKKLIKLKYKGVQ